MKHYFTPRVRTILLIVVLLAVVLTVISSLTGLSLPDMAVKGILTPIRSGISHLTDSAEKFYSYMFEYEALAAENEKLKEELANMQDMARKSESISRENARLRDLLGLTAAHEDYELVDAYVPLSISGLDFVALDAAGGEVQQMAQAEKLQVKFTIVGNESCRSGVKKLTVSVFELASGQELKQQYSVDYQNVDLPVVVPFDLTTQLGKGTYFVSVHRGKQPLGIIEVEMAQ
jgi:hypothetical protein